MGLLVKKQCGFKYEPGNETEVCILFGLLMPYLGEELEKLGYKCSEIYFEEFRGSFPDCTLIVDGKRLDVEFELYSSGFFEHGHKQEDCDLVICWEEDRPLDKVKVLELCKIVQKVPSIIENHKPKHETRMWSIQEFLEFIDKRMPSSETKIIRQFFENLEENQNLEVWKARGKLPVITIHFKKQDFHSLWIEATNKGITAGIAYYNVNVKPPEPNLPEKKIEAIRKVLNEPNKLWHYIKAENTEELINKLKKIIEVIERPPEPLNPHHSNKLSN